MALACLLAPRPAHAIPAAPTVTTLNVTNAHTGLPVTSVPMFTVVKLTAEVKLALPGPPPPQVGNIAFCEDDTVAQCLDGHAISVQQVVLLPGFGPNWGASFSFVPTFGTHTFHAVFLGTDPITIPFSLPAFASSTSALKTLHVVGPPLPGVTSTSLLSSGSPGNYTLTANILGTGAGYTPITGSVNFLDATNSNFNLGTVPVGPTNYTFSFIQPPLTPTVPALPPAFLFSLAAVANTKTIFPPVAPFNDGSPDLIFVVPNPVPLSNNYEIVDVQNQLTLGTPTFTPFAGGPIMLPGTANPLSLVTGDFNNDGNVDLAIATDDGSALYLPGIGVGAFGPPTTLESGQFLINSLAVSDPAKTGFENIYGLSPAGLVTFQNTGAGFAPLQLATYTGWDWNWTSSIAMGPFLSTVTDINFPVITNPDLNSISLLLGPPTPVSFPVGNSPSAIVTGDFNGDGFTDVAVANSGDDTVSILLGDGNGHLTTSAVLPVGVMPMYLKTGDFNGDGKLDLAVGNAGDSTITILIGGGDGATFYTSSIPADPAGGGLYGLLAADFNADGFDDVVAVNSLVPDLYLAQLVASTSATLPGVAVAGTGTHNALANYPGDTHYIGSNSNLVHLTAQPLATTLNLAALPVSPTTWGNNVTLTATLSPFAAQNHTTNGEFVHFYDGVLPIGSKPLAAGVASLTIVSPAVGLHNYRALYSGDTNFATSTGVLPYTVNRAPSSVHLSAATTPPVVGTPDLLTATVTGFHIPRGNVDFKVNGITVCSVPLDATGHATCNWTFWANSLDHVIAVYEGDIDYLPGTSNTLTFTPVVVFNPNVVLTVDNTFLTFPGQTQTVTCIHHGFRTPTGTVQIWDDTHILQTLTVGGDACAYWYISPGLHAGVQHLRAYYSGDLHYPGGFSAITSVFVQKLPTYWSVQCPQNIHHGQNEVCSIAIWSNVGPPHGNIFYSYDSAPNLQTPITGGNATIVIPTPWYGTHSIVVYYPGTDDLQGISPQSYNFTVSH